MLEPDPTAEARRALGTRVASLRKAGGLTQAALAPLVMYGRSTIANVERGRQRAPREFWIRVDRTLDAGGQLVAERQDRGGATA